MKNLLKMKNKLLKIIAIFAALLFIVVYACENEFSGSSSKEDEPQMTIKKAEAWYEANKPEETLLRSSNGKDKMVMTPVWKNAYKLKNDKYETVETDLMSYGRILFINKDCADKFDETQDPKYMQSYTHIVFRINRNTNDTVGFLMTLIPSLEWLEKSDFKPFKESTYLYRDKHFGGTVFYHNLDGSFSNGWVYEKGKIVASISSIADDSVGIELRSTVCHNVTYIVPVSTCVNTSIGTEVNGSMSYGDYQTHCWTTTYVLNATECYDDGTNSNYPGGYPDPQYPPSGDSPNNSGNPPNNPPTQPSSDPCAKGAAGVSSNNTMVNASGVKTNMDEKLTNEAKSSSNEWAANIVTNPSPSNPNPYLVIGPSETSTQPGSLPHGFIPSPPSGTTSVATAHNHTIGSVGVPSSGDLYTFLEQVRDNPSQQSMYVYGTGYQVVNGVTVQTSETYAINVYDRNAVIDFLGQFPKSSNLMYWNMGSYGYFDGWVQGTQLFTDYDFASKNYSGNESYPFMSDAAALSYIMSKYNMGVTLSRRVDNGSFKTINAQQNSSGKTSVSTCN